MTPFNGYRSNMFEDMKSFLFNKKQCMQNDICNIILLEMRYIYNFYLFHIYLHMFTYRKEYPFVKVK